MANTIKLKRGTSTPSTSDISSGEVAIDTSAQKLYINDSGTVKEIGGGTTVGGDTGVDFNDNVKARWGTGNDLEIFHNGSKSYIKDTGTGSLRINSNDFRVYNAADDEYMLRAVENGAVELYYDNVVKLQTQSWGVLINDQLKLTDSKSLFIGDGNDFQIYHDGSNTHLENTTGVLNLRNSANIVLAKAHAETLAVFTPDGANELYYDNSKKFETTSTGAKLQSTGTAELTIWAGEAANAEVHFYADENDDSIDHWKISANGADSKLNIQNYDGTSWESAISASPNGGVILYRDNDSRLNTHPNGIEVFGPAAGSAAIYLKGKEGQNSIITLITDDNDDDPDAWQIKHQNSDNSLRIQNKGGGSYEDNIVGNHSGNVELYYDNSKKLQTTSTGTTITGQSLVDTGTSLNSATNYSGENFGLLVNSNQGNDNGNEGNGICFAQRWDASDTAKIRTGAVIGYKDSGTGGFGGGLKLKVQQAGANPLLTALTLKANGDVRLPADSQKLQLGASQDLQLYHDGTHSYIQNSTGNLVLTSVANEIGVRVKPNAEVELYYDNSKKLETTSSGIEVSTGFVKLGTNTPMIDSSGHISYNVSTNNGVAGKHKFLSNGSTECLVIDHDGNADFGGDINVLDNKKLLVGTGDDLQIFHDGSHSYIQDSGTGNLNIDSSSVLIRNPTGTEDIAKFIQDGAVELYYDNSKKAETTDTGLTCSEDLQVDGDLYIAQYIKHTGDTDTRMRFQSDVWSVEVAGNERIETNNTRTKFFHNIETTGTCTATAFSGDGSSLTGISAGGGDTGIDFNDDVKVRFGTGNDLQIFADGSNSEIQHNGDGHLLIKSGFGTTAIKCVESGAVELYNNGTKKAETVSGGFTVSGTCTATAFSGDGSSLTGISASDSTKLPLAGGTLTGNTKLNDNVELQLGGGSDFQAKHDGTDTSLYNYTGDLYLGTVSSGDDVHIVSIDDIYLKCQGGEDGLKIMGNGEVRLYYDDSRKAETYASGFLLDGSVLKFENVASTPSASGNTHIYAHDGKIKICGGSGIQFEEGGFTRWHITSGALHPHGTTYNNLGNSTNRVGNAYIQTSVDLVDSAELRIGSSDDLKLWHGSGHSWIKNITGSLYVAADAFRVSYADMTGTMITADNGGKVAIYYDNSKKLDTNSGGVKVYGNLDVDDNNKLRVGTSSDLQIFHDGNNSYINHGGTGSLYVQSNSSGDDLQLWSMDDIYIRPQGGEEGVKVIGNAHVSLYYDNSQKFYTQSDKCVVAGHFYPESTNSYDLGHPSYRWRNLYVEDMHFSNESKDKGNDIDGTWGDWTLQEGDENIFMINNRTGKKYKMALQEVV